MCPSMPRSRYLRSQREVAALREQLSAEGMAREEMQRRLDRTVEAVRVPAWPAGPAAAAAAQCGSLTLDSLSAADRAGGRRAASAGADSPGAPLRPSGPFLSVWRRDRFCQLVGRPLERGPETASSSAGGDNGIDHNKNWLRFTHVFISRGVWGAQAESDALRSGARGGPWCRFPELVVHVAGLAAICPM
eukprot:COSAG01_NODE_177_length_22954_cov_28.699554_20_plen_190_part_00